MSKCSDVMIDKKLCIGELREFDTGWQQQQLDQCIAATRNQRKFSLRRLPIVAVVKSTFNFGVNCTK